MSGLFDHVADPGLKAALERFYRTARGKERPRAAQQQQQPLWQRCGDCGGRTRWDGTSWRCAGCTCAGG